MTKLKIIPDIQVAGARVDEMKKQREYLFGLWENMKLNLDNVRGQIDRLDRNIEAEKRAVSAHSNKTKKEAKADG